MKKKTKKVKKTKQEKKKEIIPNFEDKFNKDMNLFEKEINEVHENKLI